MRKILSLLLEELIVCGVLILIGMNCPKSILPDKNTWICGLIIIGIAIAIAKAGECYMDGLMLDENRQFHISRIERAAMYIILLCPVFCVGFFSMEYFLHVPASNRTILLCGLGLSIDHLGLSSLTDKITGLSVKDFKDMFHALDDEDDDDEYVDMG